jgi:hypothetical protein
MTGQLKVLQCNLNRSIQATESALQLAVELKIDILAVQEPWLPPLREKLTYDGIHSISHAAYNQIFPSFQGNRIRPRAMFYISQQSGMQVNQCLEYPEDPDFLVLKISWQRSYFHIFNFYNQKNQEEENNLTTIQRIQDRLTIPSKSILVGDFNEHHPDPRGTYKYNLSSGKGDNLSHSLLCCYYKLCCLEKSIFF